METFNYRDPKVWGSGTWILLHCMSFTCPDVLTLSYQKRYYRFMKLLAKLLPCSVCGDHLSMYLERYPFRAETRNEFIHYVIHLHNYVNRKYKKQKSLSISKAKELIYLNCKKKKSGS